MSSTDPPAFGIRIRRSRLLHFVVLGGLVFAASRGWRRGDAHTLVIRAADIARLEQQWTAQHGTAPSAAERPQMIDAAVDAEILQREAAALGLRDDRLVRDRLVKLGRFLGLAEAGAAADDATVDREAHALGLEREDPVIRRYLAHLTEIALAGPAELPSEDEVRRRYAELEADAITPTRYRLVHVYLARDVHGTALAADGQRLLREIRDGGRGPEVAGALGDPFVTSAHIGPATTAQLARTFGPELAAAVETAPTGQWLEPLPSSYGLHLLWIEERLPGRPPDLEAVRNQIVHDLVRERQVQRQGDGLRALRARYRIEVEAG